MANIIGNRNTGNILQARRVVDMAKEIALLDPNDSPFVTFLKVAQGKTRPVFNPKFSWLEDGLTSNVTAVNGAVLAAATSIAVDDGTVFSAYDVAELASGEHVLVTAVNANTLTVVRGFGTTAAADISDDDVIRRIGTAMPENSNVPNAKSTATTEAFNYTQIFRTPINLSKTEEVSKLHGGDDRSYQRRKASIEHKRAIAMAMYFGEKKEDTTGPAPIRTTAGLDSFLTQAVAFDATSNPLTFSAFDNQVAQLAFSHGSQNKLLLAGGYLASVINSWANDKLVTAVDESKTFGIRVQKLVTSYGDINVIYDPLLNRVHSDYGYLIDTDNIRYCPLEGRDTKLYTDIQANGVDGIIDEYLTECGLEVKLPQTHVKITGAYAS